MGERTVEIDKDLVDDWKRHPCTINLLVDLKEELESRTTKVLLAVGRGLGQSHDTIIEVGRIAAAHEMIESLKGGK